MRLCLALMLCLIVSGLVVAQDNPSPYAIARERIHEAQTTGATQLNLSGMSLHKLPPEIGTLSNLLELELGGNNLNTLPPEIGNLSNLQALALWDNQLSSLPPEIGNLSNLQTLHLYN